MRPTRIAKGVNGYRTPEPTFDPDARAGGFGAGPRLKDEIRIESLLKGAKDWTDLNRTARLIDQSFQGGSPANLRLWAVYNALARARRGKILDGTIAIRPSRARKLESD